MMFAGRDYAALRLQLQVREQVVETLQPRGAALNPAQDHRPALARAHGGVANEASLIEAWRARNARISPFGFLGWLSEVWPWLLGLGFALPVLGALIGAQASREGSVADDTLQVRVGGSGEHKNTNPSHGADLAEPRIPVPNPNPPKGEDSEASRSLSPDPVAWTWNARPAARTAPSRPKPLPVKSPHGEQGSEGRG
jgi:hypothetical protein